MIKHYQTIFGQGKGNCLQACLATVLQLDMQDVPHFAAMEGDWFKKLNAWLNARGRGVTATEFRGPRFWELLAESGGYFIMFGKGKRSGGQHVVIYHKGELWHDPMPGGEGLDLVEGCLLVYDLCKPTGNLLDVRV